MTVIFLLMAGGAIAVLVVAFFLAATRAKNAFDFFGIFLLVLFVLGLLMYGVFYAFFGGMHGINM